MKKESLKYINREISWLSFNERVLQEAADTRVPLMERLKFLGIFSSNLDEFFSVRVGTLRRMIDAGIKGKVMFGGSPREVLQKIQSTVLALQNDFDDVFKEISKELEKNKIYILNEKNLKDYHKEYISEYFDQKIHSSLVPLMLDENKKFPYLKNHVIYLAIHMYRQEDPADYKYALIEVPADILSRYISLPSKDDKKYVIILDDIIRFGLKDIFAIFNYDRIDAYTIKLTRDAELDFEEDVTKSFFEKVMKSLEERKRGQPVRFVYDREIPEHFLNFILRKSKMDKFENLIPGGRYHNARDFMNFPRMGMKELEYQKTSPLPHPSIETHRSILKAIKKKDILLHYPYQSFDYMIDLLREAAIDPMVTSIKITLYRVAKNSKVINALTNAIKNGKNVTVVMELQARFDEKANIYWTQMLEDAGAILIDGVPGLKVHAKLCQIERKEGNESVFYSAIATGNFNESTAKLYSDHCLFTFNTQINEEVNKLFEFFEHNYKVYDYQHLLVAPHQLRKKYLSLIQKETENASMGKEAFICAKMNSLVDKKMIDALYEANNAGVKINLIIRGICSLVPGVEGQSENINVISIVDKYLEHSRIFIFCNEGDTKYYISSADWMVRNLDKRVEVATPIYDPDIQKELRDFMKIQFNDRKKARIINEKQDNPYLISVDDKEIRCQDEIYEYLARKTGQANK